MLAEECLGENVQVIVYHLGEDAASVRWAMSPIHEVVSLARLLTEPHRHPMFHSWLRRRRQRLSAVDLEAVTVFMADGRYRPDFLDPPPDRAEPTFEDGVAALFAAPLRDVEAEIRDAMSGRPVALTRRLQADPARTRAAAARAVTALWNSVVEPEWPSMRAALRAELLDRAIAVGREGLAPVLSRLHPSVAFDGHESNDQKLWMVFGGVT